MTLNRKGSDQGNLNPDMLVLAREARGMTQAELASRIGISQSLLSKIETGLIPASEENLRAVTVALDFPPAFFMSTEPVYGPSTSEFFHRKRAAARMKLMDKIHAQINIRTIFISRLLKAAEVEVDIPHLDPDEYDGDAAEIARVVRAKWQLPKGPIKNVTKTLEDAGAIVVRMPFESRLVDAVSWWVPGLPPMFFVNNTLTADRERLTLCHELGHAVMHTVARPGMEDEANLFAAEFLMPDSDIRHQLHNVSVHLLATLKPYWRVSMAALLKRTQDLKVISAGQARRLWIAMAPYRTREPAELDFPKEEPALLQEIIDLHSGSLAYDLPQLAQLLTLWEYQVPEYFNLKLASGDPRSNRLRVVK